MIRLIYTLGVYFYTFIIFLFSFFNEKAKLWINGRKNFFEELENSIHPNKKYVWFHCSSLGEFEQAKPLIENLKNNYNKNILVTFFSPSGYEIRKYYKEADVICYLPSDTIKNSEKFLKTINIEAAFFIKYEFWFNYIYQLHLNKIPLYLVSGVFRENQLFFKFYGKWFKKHLYYFKYFFLQNQQSYKILNDNNITNCCLTGDTRFDRVLETLKQNEELIDVLKFKNNQPLLVLGSSWNQEEALFYQYLSSHKNNVEFQTIIAPHDVSPKHIEQIELLFKNQNTALFSKKNDHENTEILIIDSIGLLSRIYKYADVAVIGGAFGKGLHNILEPAVFGVPMIFGPKVKRFQEALDLIELNGVSSVNNQLEFDQNLDALLNNTELRNQKSIILKEYVTQNIGATEKIIQTIKL